MKQHPTGEGEQHDMPATSRTEPTSHGDPGRFFANHPPIVWPILGVLAVVVAIGMVGVYLVASNANDTNPRGDAQGVNVRGEQTAVANAGIGNGNTSVTVGENFAPASLVVPRGTGAVIAVDGGGAPCQLKNNEDSVAALDGGESYTFTADRPGEFRFSCNGQPQRGQLILTVP
ncbi:MAG: hypothetical protein IPG47_11205 [Thermoflexaceae bacterium]|nr:hypothetical protein [Thermoflexaceae bacterium]